VTESIGLGDNGDQVDTGAQALHHLDIERLQGVSGGSDEIQACMDTHVNLVGSAGLLLLKHVRLMLVVQEFDDRLPRITVVHVVSKAGGINNGEAD
jgi:hypothetical protein